MFFFFLFGCFFILWVFLCFLKENLVLSGYGGGEDLEGHWRGEECEQNILKLKKIVLNNKKRRMIKVHL